MRTFLTLVTVSIALTACNAPTMDAPTQAAEAVAPIKASQDPECDPTAYPFGGGNGTAYSPNTVCSTDQFREIGKWPNDFFVLAADLDFTTLPEYVTPRTFYGTLDGNGHTVSGLTIRHNVFWVQGQQPTYLGLFYSLGQNGLVENLTLANLDVQGWANVGAVAGKILAMGHVQNVHIISGHVGAGSGIAGSIAADNAGSIYHCDSAIGGLVNSGTGTID